MDVEVSVLAVGCKGTGHDHDTSLSTICADDYVVSIRGFLLGASFEIVICCNL